MQNFMVLTIESSPTIINNDGCIFKIVIASPDKVNFIAIDNIANYIEEWLTIMIDEWTCISFF